jgi:hypothetical protein
MRKRYPDMVEKGRIKGGAYTTPHGDTCGAFVLKTPAGEYLRVLVSDGAEWTEHELPGVPFEHVSVSHVDRCPTWEEMCWVKGLFWEPEEVVIQYNPPESEYVNRHQFCLHLFRPIGVEIPRPPKECVG